MMKSILAQLQSNEAVLLMYLAGELPQQDRAEVEKWLEQDGELRAQLENLRAAMGSVERQLKDAGEVDDVSVARARREATAAMRLRSLEQRPAQVRAPEAVKWRIPGWAYPAAAAAILLVAVSLYLANLQPPKEVAVGSEPAEMQAADLIAMAMEQQPEADVVAAAETADDLAATFDDGEWVVAEALDGDGLVGAMQELGEIQRLSGEAAGVGAGTGAGVVQ